MAVDTFFLAECTDRFAGSGQYLLSFYDDPRRMWEDLDRQRDEASTEDYQPMIELVFEIPLDVLLIEEGQDMTHYWLDAERRGRRFFDIWCSVVDF